MIYERPSMYSREVRPFYGNVNPPRVHCADRVRGCAPRRQPPFSAVSAFARSLAALVRDVRAVLNAGLFR